MGEADVEAPSADGGAYWESADPARDRRLARVVTPVKNQGQCGSCWAFSATSQVESDWAVGGNALNAFAVQQIASCDARDQGCGGGNPVWAYEYLMGNATAGLVSAWAWPYVQSMLPAETCLDATCTASCGARDLGALVSHTFAVGPYARVTDWTLATRPCFGDCNEQRLGALRHALASRGPGRVRQRRVLVRLRRRR